MFNKTLLKLAEWRLKNAFVPPGDPSAMGGAPGGDPSMAAGGMDPAAMGGGAPPGAAPPPDPSAGGGGMPDISTMVQTAVQQAMAQQGGQPGAAGMAGKAPGASKQEQENNTRMDIYQVKKMLTYWFNLQGIPLPPDILDGPNRDPQSGMAVPPNTPGSTSDPNKPSPPPPQQSAIKPMEAMQPAMPTGGEKQGQEFGNIKERATALAQLAHNLKKDKLCV